MALDLGNLMDRSDEIWEQSILPSLSDFIEIKALSPLFEPDWGSLGELDATIELFCKWLDEQGISGHKKSNMKHEIKNLTTRLRNDMATYPPQGNQTRKFPHNHRHLISQIHLYLYHMVVKLFLVCRYIYLIMLP